MFLLSYSNSRTRIICFTTWRMHTPTHHIIMNGVSGRKRVGPQKQVMGFNNKYDSMEQRTRCDRCPALPHSTLGINGNLANVTLVIFWLRSTPEMHFCLFSSTSICLYTSASPTRATAMPIWSRWTSGRSMTSSQRRREAWRICLTKGHTTLSFLSSSG